MWSQSRYIKQSKWKPHSNCLKTLHFWKKLWFSFLKNFGKFRGYKLSRTTWKLQFRGYKLSRTIEKFAKSRKFLPAKLYTFKVSHGKTSLTTGTLKIDRKNALWLVSHLLMEKQTLFIKTALITADSSLHFCASLHRMHTHIQKCVSDKICVTNPKFLKLCPIFLMNIYRTKNLSDKNFVPTRLCLKRYVQFVLTESFLRSSWDFNVIFKVCLDSLRLQ